MYAGGYELEVKDRVLATHVVVRRISAASRCEGVSTSRIMAVKLQIATFQVMLRMPPAREPSIKTSCCASACSVALGRLQHLTSCCLCCPSADCLVKRRSQVSPAGQLVG